MAEKLVEKCGISYEEAGNTLKEANYDLLEAMIILERRGKLGGSNKNSYSTQSMGDYIAYRKDADSDPENFGEFIRYAGKRLREIFNDILSCQIVISRNNREWVTFPMILALILILCTAGTAFVAVIVSLICGCSYSIRKNGG